jgi:exodeoxyribonuclease VII large subunit
MEEIILSVSEYIEITNEILKQEKVKVIGEVIKANIYPSGHVYFTLKDKNSGSVLDCIMWKYSYQLYGITLEAGLEVILTGSGNLYEKTGKFSFVASAVELVGEGMLKKAYEQLREKLEIEGIFSIENKREIPAYIKKIGLITSKQGAVIHDFTNNLSRHGFKIKFISTHVEGNEALKDILAALRTLKQHDLDVIIIMRGGGSLQSLQAFDNENLVREIVESPIPVLAAIGHHEDVPLAALAADHMVSTPTAAANLISSSWDKGLDNLEVISTKLLNTYKEKLNNTAFTTQLRESEIIKKFESIITVFDYVSNRLNSYQKMVAYNIKASKEDLNSATQKITCSYEELISELKNEIARICDDQLNKMTNQITGEQKQIEAFEKIIKMNDPARLLSLGYSLARVDGKLVKSIKNVNIGDRVSIELSDGEITSNVVNTN